MGEFSFLKADRLTKVANIVYGQTFQLLIPEPFGGGAIKGTYSGYGLLVPKSIETRMYDMYELVAFWNGDQEVTSDFVQMATRWHAQSEIRPRWDNTKPLRDVLRFDESEFPLMKEVDRNTYFNRGIGIELYRKEHSIERLRYPLKLVSASYSGTYEQCPGISIGDPKQGLSPLRREDNLIKWGVSTDSINFMERALCGKLESSYQTLKRTLLAAGPWALGDFCGCNTGEDTNITEEFLDEVAAQMPDEEFRRYCEKYGV